MGGRGCRAGYKPVEPGRSGGDAGSRIQHPECARLSGGSPPEIDVSYIGRVKDVGARMQSQSNTSF